MKTKSLSLSLFIMLQSVAFQCHDDQSRKSGEEDQETCSEGGTPGWINDTINTIEANGLKGEVIRYRYKGQYAFLIDGCYECPDYMSAVYNCNQELLCSFGGIAGINTCPDFSDKATDEKIIWKNHD